MIKHIFDFSGRAGRLEFFIHSILDIVFIIGGLIAVAVLYEAFGIETNEIALFGTFAFIIITGAVAELSVTVRRFHDMGMSGWYIWGNLVPLYNIYLHIILLFKQGEACENQYGPSLH